MNRRTFFKILPALFLSACTKERPEKEQPDFQVAEGLSELVLEWDKKIEPIPFGYWPQEELFNNASLTQVLSNGDRLYWNFIDEKWVQLD